MSSILSQPPFNDTIAAANPVPVVNERLITRHFRRAVALVTFVCAIFTVGAILSFPATDDAYVFLGIKELGAAGVYNTYPHMALVEHIWYALASWFGLYFWPVAIFLNCIIWIAFGIVSCRLWLTLFPNDSGYAPLVGCLSVAPIVVQVQTTTITVSSIAVLSAVLGYEALLLMLYHLTDGRRWFYWVSLAFTSISIMLSGYGLSSALIISVLLMQGPWSKWDPQMRLRARRASFMLLAVTVLTSLIFLPRFRDLMVNPQAPVNGITLVGALPLGILSSLWHATIGAYSTMIESFSLTWESKTLLLSVFFGILFAWIGVSKITESRMLVLESRASIRAALVALIAGLAPIAFLRAEWVPTNRLESEFATRFFIPAMPLAACITVLLLLIIARPRLRPFAAYGLLLLAGFALFNQVWTGFHRQQTLSSIGNALRNYVSPVGANVVAVLSNENLCLADYSCTAEVSSHWSGDMSKRFWLYKQSEALKHLGSRTRCQASFVDAGFRSLRRKGSASNVLWIQMAGDTFTIEPYCLSQTGIVPAPAPVVPPRETADGPVSSSSTAGVTEAAAPVPHTPGAAKPELIGSISIPSGVQNLSLLGTEDWAHWGEGHFHHKAGVKERINYFKVIGTDSVHYFYDGPLGFTWSGGVNPGPAATDSRTGILVNGPGNGLEIEAFADNTPRTLSVYVGVWKTRGRLVAHLSDGSAPDFIDESLENKTGPAVGLYKLTYRAASSDQTLYVTYTQAGNDPTGNIALPAATLVQEKPEKQ